MKIDFGEPRERYIHTQEHISRIVAQLIEGKVPADIPWSDPAFQQGVLAAFGALRRYKADAEKLAVVKEVFGGK